MKITGKTLIDLGYKPSKWFGEAIEYINANELKESEIPDYINTILPPRPPFPPSGPPLGTNFSRLNDILPAPPLPDLQVTFVKSINIVD